MRAIPGDGSLHQHVDVVRGDGLEAKLAMESERGEIRAVDGRANRDAPLVGLGDDLAEDPTADSATPVLRQESHVDDTALVVGPRDPDATDGFVPEQDHVVLRVGESRSPALTLRSELQIEERLACRDLPVRHVGPGRGVEPAQERLVEVGRRPPRDVQFRDG
jgi:hypothetical protein